MTWNDYLAMALGIAAITAPIILVAKRKSLLRKVLSQPIRRRRTAEYLLRFAPREIMLLDSVDDQLRANAFATIDCITRGRTWLAWVGLAAVGIVAASSLGVLLMNSPTAWHRWMALCILIVFPVAYSVAWAVYCRRVTRRCLIDYLCDQGIAICRSCRYDLRGQIEPRCPECGRAVAVHPASPGSAVASDADAAR